MLSETKVASRWALVAGTGCLLILATALVVSHRGNGERSASAKVATHASAPTTPVPSWMTSCLSAQHLDSSAAPEAAAQTMAATVPSASAENAAVADHPGLSRTGMVVVPIEVSSGADSTAAVSIPALDSLSGKALWAVGFVGLHIPISGQFVLGQTTQATPYETSWIELIDGETGEVALGVGCM